MSSTTKVMRTYGSCTTKIPPPSSPPSELTSSPVPSQIHKRPILEDSSIQNSPPVKRQRNLPKSSMKPAAKSKTVLKSQKAKRKPQQKLTQLHFALDVTVLRTCRLCDLSYTKGAPDDESLHRAHCARVRKGLQWGREEERETLKAGVEEVTTGLKLKNGTKGRVICFRPDVGGKIGVKLTTLLETISLALSSPPLSPAVLQHCKVYIFLLSPDSASSHTSRERIVGCVIAQRIATAMAIASDVDLSTSNTSISHPTSDTSKDAKEKPTQSLIPVDAATNLYVHPDPLPTPLGIPRLFVSSSHRRLGIASHLLSAAASTFILGCPLDPAKGQIAFTQPTGAGKAVLEAWGKGGIRIYEEEQSP